MKSKVGPALGIFGQDTQHLIANDLIKCGVPPVITTVAVMMLLLLEQPDDKQLLARASGFECIENLYLV